jgi:NAD(P)H-hydrate epimerase
MFQTIPNYISELDEAFIKQKSVEVLHAKLKTFDRFSHKGDRGHAALFAGSIGMMGASILAARACSKSGAGKITTIVPPTCFNLIHSTVPEAIVVSNETQNLNYSIFNSIGIGPGLGSELLDEALITHIFSYNMPMVLDADALNFLAKHPTLIEQIPKSSILTPHLLEWKRLFGDVSHDRDRIEKSISISTQYGIFILIKGHISCLTTPTGKVHFNATGNAGMAKGGSGDVLTGLITGLLAQGYTPETAALLGMYIHGRAGDMAKTSLGEEAMTASDQLHFFSAAFTEIRNI